jgi:hypothetical protein
MEAYKILETVRSLGSASNGDVLNMISNNSSESRRLLRNAFELVKKTYKAMEDLISAETNKEKKKQLTEEFNSFKIAYATHTSLLKAEKDHFQRNTKQYKKLERILERFIRTPSLQLDQETAKEIQEIKETLQKNKDNFLGILKDRQIFDDFQKKIESLKTIKHKKKYAVGIGLLTSLLTGGSIGTVAAIDGCCGAAGCISIFSGVWLLLGGIGLALATGACVGFVLYKIFKDVEKNVEESFDNSAEMKQMLELLEKQNQLSKKSITFASSSGNLDELEKIHKKIGENPMKYEEDHDICQCLSNENDEIIKSLNELIQFNDSIQNAKF